MSNPRPHEDDAGIPDLADFIDVQEVQGMMDDFFGIADVAVAILDTEGKVLVATGWQDICTKFHRVHPEACRHCTESDTVLALGVELGTFKLYRCMNHMWDMATPIVLDGQHVGNLYLGQFFFTDETPDREVFRAQAKRYGFDEDEYLAALDRVPRWSREKINQIMTVYARFAKLISAMSYRNWQSQQALAEREALLNSLQRSEALLDATQHLSKVGGWEWDVASQRVFWTDEIYRILGIDPMAAPCGAVTDLERIAGFYDLPQRTAVLAAFQRCVEQGEPYSLEVPLTSLTGERRWVRTTAQAVRQDGRIVKVFGSIMDITERRLEEEKLRQSEVRHRTILETAMDGFWVVDMDGSLLEVNRAYCQMSGYSEEELLTMAIADVEANDTPADIATRIQQTVAQGQLRFESRHRRRDGSIMDVEVGVQAQSPNGGHVVAFIRDITERKKREAELRLHSLVLEQIHDQVTVTDLDGVISYVNQAEVDVLGRQKEEFLGQPVAIYGDDPARGATQREIIERTAREGSWRGEVVNFSADGCERILDCRTQLVLDEQGAPMALCGIATDITERKRAEEQLSLSQTRLRLFIDANSDLIFLKDLDLKYQMVNAANAAFFGCEEAEIIGRSDSDFMPGEAARACRESDLQAIRKRRPVMTVETVADRIYETRKLPIVIADELVGVAGIVRDITEHRALEAKFQQAQKMESVGRLAGGVAHDFNNMLNVILGHTELAIEQLEPGQPLHDGLREIQKAAERSAKLTRQLLAFARKQTAAPQVLDLNQTVGSMLSMVKRLIGEDLDLAWLPGGDVRPVWMDPSQIDQILANLCVNARDAIANIGRITIETGTVVLDEDHRAVAGGVTPGTYVLLAVSDNGCGMDQEIQGKLFEPFFTTKEVGKGTGLGLATVYGIVKQNGGAINVYSEPGEGTTFRIYLPPFGDQGGQLPGAGASEPVQRGQETILLVEDEQAVLRLTRIQLERLGYRVLAASTPGEGLRLAREHTGGIQLLITDVVMPEMNGRQLAKEILSLHPGIKRLFMSGYTASAIAHHGVLDGGLNFVQKPFSRKELGDKVREALDGD